LERLAFPEIDPVLQELEGRVGRGADLGMADQVLGVMDFDAGVQPELFVPQQEDRDALIFKRKT